MLEQIEKLFTANDSSGIWNRFLKAFHAHGSEIHFEKMSETLRHLVEVPYISAHEQIQTFLRYPNRK